jgi:hypothetical protein
MSFALVKSGSESDSVASGLQGYSPHPFEFKQGFAFGAALRETGSPCT